MVQSRPAPHLAILNAGKRDLSFDGGVVNAALAQQEELPFSKTLINDSVQRVDQGTSLVDQAGSTMTELVASVQRVSSIMAEITSANREQNASIERVNQSIVHLEEVTHVFTRNAEIHKPRLPIEPQENKTASESYEYT